MKTTATNTAQLHGVNTVMKRLGVGRSMVFDLIKSGELRSIKIHNRRLVSEAAIVDFIAGIDQ
jgi:excisionase family DNA binding protein